MGVGPVPAASIDRWADRNLLDPDDAEVFRYVVRQMDNVYIEWKGKKQNDADKGEKPLPKASEHPMSPRMFDSMFG